MINVPERLRFWAGLKPNELAFVDGKKEITFAELHIHTLKVAATLEKMGIGSGDLVCTILPAYLDWPITLALQILGTTSFAKPSGANFDLVVDPKWLITSKEHPQFSLERTILVDQDFAEKVNESELRLSEAVPIDASHPIRLNSTSGTTGEVKYFGINEIDVFHRIQSTSGVSYLGNKKFLSLFPFGASQNYFWAHRALLEGKTYFVLSPKDESIFEFLKRYDIRTIYGSPQQILGMLENIENKGTSLDSNFNLILGGSAPSSQLLKKIRKNHRSSIYNSHGSAETGFISICNISDEDYPGLIVHPSVRVQIVDERSNESEQGQIGIIRYKIPHGATHYLNNAEATEKSFKDGYFYSGDMGYKTLDGRLFITGRSNEIINLGGVKVNPEQIDEMVLSEPGIADAAAFALDHESGVPKLAIALVVDHEFDEAEFVQTMKGKFTRAKIEGIFRVNAIPRNPNGKILRRELNRKFSKQ